MKTKEIRGLNLLMMIVAGLMAQAAQADGCAEWNGFEPDRFGNMTRVTTIKQPTPGYALGDVLIAHCTPGSGIATQDIFRNGVFVGREVNTNGDQTNIRPQDINLNSQPSATYVPGQQATYTPSAPVCDWQKLSQAQDYNTCRALGGFWRRPGDEPDASCNCTSGS